jgi:hypothetical protein
VGKKLNQVVAIEKDVKARSYKDLTKEHHLLQKPDSVSGFSKTYQPLREDGEVFPPESRVVQNVVEYALQEVAVRLGELWDLTYTKDVGNQQARGDVVVGGKTLLGGVPVPTLLFLEKQLADMHTFLSKLPTLPTDETWTFDNSKGYHITEPTKTVKTRKEKKVIVLYPATDKHPAQTQLVDEDVTIGHWTTIKHSGAISNDRRRQLIERCELLQDAVKVARERANLQEVDEQKMARTIFLFLFGGQ